MTHNWGKGRKKHVPTKLRNQILNRDNHTCKIQKPGCTHTATEVDHITNIRQGGTNYSDNLQAVCHTCHKRKTQQEAAQARAKNRRSAQYPQEKHPALPQ